MRPPGGIKHKGTSSLRLCQLTACTVSIRASALNVQTAAGIHCLGYQVLPVRRMLQQSHRQAGARQGSESLACNWRASMLQASLLKADARRTNVCCWLILL